MCPLFPLNAVEGVGQDAIARPPIQLRRCLPRSMKRAQMPALLSPQHVFRGFPPIVRAMLGGAPYAVNRHEISFPVSKMAAKWPARMALAPVSGFHGTP